ncbi:VOC family protein [Membranihabitans maritimus]|uniref:VOC family protein n=1 Tax=Membranihabitans maritimus TaxID=2904244 RepID=UPI001F274CDF|nr:VOC family protein [Membranihabitans maritimus]
MPAKIDPIIAVHDLTICSKWYQDVLGFKNIHGNPERFVVLTGENEEIMLCLHKWGEDEHPTMKNPELNPGNGLILYFRTDNLEAIRQNIQNINWPVEEEIHFNSNSTKREFSVRDPEGYFITITEYHKYEG